MKRRTLLKWGAAALCPWTGALTRAQGAPTKSLFRRVRPSDPAWPGPAEWARLDREVGGHLIKVAPPLDECRRAPGDAACAEFFKELKNPYYVGDHVALTQTCGWADAWVSAPSVYAVAAKDAQDVVAAVNFARANKLRLVVKGGGHSYQGTSNSADSLMIWTRAMDQIELSDAFVAEGCAGRQEPQPAVTIGAGAIWMHVYDAVTTKGGRYVQGGGCATVGVAGLVQSGGFGSFSKNYGLAAGSLLQAEVVTADGVVRVANACANLDLFWGLKGGGGGSLGVVTRLTLRTHDLPNFFGGAQARIKARSDAAFRRLIGRFFAFYADRLFNRQWGEIVTFRPDNSLDVAMVFMGMTQAAAAKVWRPFFDWIAQSPQDFVVASPPRFVSAPAQRFWDPDYLTTHIPGAALADDRPGAPADNIFWSGNLGEAGQFLYGYDSVWLPASLLAHDQQTRLVDALFAGSRGWRISLHFNKGLARTPPAPLADSRNTAMNPVVFDAFALADSAGGGPPAFPGAPGHEPDLAAARKTRAGIEIAMRSLRALAPEAGSYVSESDFFNASWPQAFWGANYAELQAVKAKYDPDGLFFVHHGVGSETWSADGFTRLG